MTALYIATGRLWASIGYHMAWNFTEAYVFGAGVSGSDFGPSLFQVRARPGVDAFWTGGTFGPEASVVTLVFGLLVSAALITLAKRQKRFVLRRQRWLCKKRKATCKSEEPGLSLPGSSSSDRRSDGKDRNDPHIIIHDDDFVLVDEVLPTPILRINFDQDRRHLDQVDRPRHNSANPDRKVHIRYLRSSGDHGFPNVSALFGR